MSVRNLWGEIPAAQEIRLPVTILREQASVLGEETNKILEAKVDPRSEGASFRYDLDIHAPALDNYRFTVLTILYGVSIYPVHVTAYAPSRKFTCVDEPEFVAALQEILSSEEVHRTIAQLLTLSKAEKSGMFA